MTVPPNTDEPGAGAAPAEHDVLAPVVALLLWPALLLLAGALAHLIVPSFLLGSWVWSGSYVAIFGKAVLVALPGGVVAFGVTNLIFGHPFWYRRR